MVLILPQWAQDVIQRAPQAIAEILGRTTVPASILRHEASQLAGGLSAPASPPPPPGRTLPFTVSIRTPEGASAGFETETTLGGEWINKPLREALIGPALHAYMQSNPLAQRASVDEIRVSVDGRAVDGSLGPREARTTDVALRSR